MTILIIVVLKNIVLITHNASFIAIKSGALCGGLGQPCSVVSAGNKDDTLPPVLFSAVCLVRAIP